MRRRKQGSPTPLSTLVGRAYPARTPADQRALHAYAWWDRAVPPRVAEKARPVRLVRGVLTIHAETSVWAQELDLLRGDILRSVQRAAPTAGVRELRIRVGLVPQIAGRPEIVLPPPIKPLAPEALPEEVARAVASIPDAGVRDAVMNAAAVSLAPAQTAVRATAKGKSRASR